MSPLRPIASIILIAASLAAGPSVGPTAFDRPGQRLERVLSLDDLTAEQRKRIEAILAEARGDIDRARSTTAPAQRGEVRDVFERARVRIAAVLTPAQRDRLRANARDEDRPAAATPSTRPTTAPAPPAAATPPVSAPTTRAVGTVGERLPNFSLANVAGGKPITFESLVGKPFVLLFGSYSSPAFRDQLPRLADLSTRYGSRAKFVVVYTREMFPTTQSVDQPERNQDEKIDVPAATTDAARLAAAKLLVDKLKVKLPVGVDAIDDRLTDVVNGFPNAAMLVDAKGVIVSRWTWAEPFAIKRELDLLFPTR